MMAAHKTIGLWKVMMAMLLFIVACKPEQNQYTPTPYELEQPSYFPSKNNIPADNPMTEEGDCEPS